MGIQSAKELGAAIRTRRQKLGYTQSQLADASGASLMFVSQLENGKETVQLGKALRVANMVGIDVNLSERGN
ncbi:helix-turn-helix domain-containing protein [Adlercreutzia sp. ZJ242]|uniref:helix-turn-helix domain-containing protein n=1 Tax=Adlercreutzia sp. ZJ242 TaxID=2709409 RepID=UPI0013EA38D2|nr:helix-turn-helix domain-containing protein [Adlercreutzia sp. ZJ242]